MSSNDEKSIYETTHFSLLMYRIGFDSGRNGTENRNRRTERETGHRVFQLAKKSPLLHASAYVTESRLKRLVRKEKKKTRIFVQFIRFLV